MSGQGWQRTGTAGARPQVIVAFAAALAETQPVTPEPVLQRMVDTAREVVPARYAALGVSIEQDAMTSGVLGGG
jgi:hypothetical protein